MQIEVYKMAVNSLNLEITLEAVCDSFSSFLWDVEYYSCGAFEIYISATPENLNIFRTGKIVGRSDDKNHYGIIEKIQLNADAEKGDYLTVSGRFLMSLLSRRIIYPQVIINTEMAYHEIVKKVINWNCFNRDSVLMKIRGIPGLKIGSFSGKCWENTTRLQVSYENLMEWIYKICETISGTANIRLQSTENSSFSLVFELSQGTDRSVSQDENPHIIFSDIYNNLLSFDYLFDYTEYRNFAYIFGCDEGIRRKNTFVHTEENTPQYFDRYECYVDARDLSDEVQVDGIATKLPDNEYYAMLKERGAENLVPITETSESTISVDGRQYQYNKDYFLGDYVTVEHRRFGLIQPKIQLVGMIESFDSNGHQLTPKFKGV